MITSIESPTHRFWTNPNILSPPPFSCLLCAGPIHPDRGHHPGPVCLVLLHRVPCLSVHEGCTNCECDQHSRDGRGDPAAGTEGNLPLHHGDPATGGSATESVITPPVKNNSDVI